MKEVEIYTDTIRLDQLLKFSGTVQTGGQGKMLIRDSMVKVNGKVTRTRGMDIKKRRYNRNREHR